MIEKFSRLGLGLLLGLAAVLGCRAESSQECLPGQTRQCADPALDCRGAQTCTADGLGWGECSCAALPATIEGPSSGPEGITPIVARACRADGDCGAGLRCLTAVSNDFFGGGGPAGGYCTASCATSQDCQAIDRNSECLVNGGTGLCVETCYSKTPPIGEGKCAGRADLVCLSDVAFGAAYTSARQHGQCLPRCRSNAECAGRVCNLQSGLCQATQAPGLPIGAACVTNQDCAGGSCLALTADGDQTCSAQCRLDPTITDTGCGSLGGGATPEASCIFARFSSQGSLLQSSEGVGDLGACLELCDTAADCQNPAFACLPVPAVRAGVDRFGICGPASLLPPDAGTPDDAGAGGAGGSGGTGGAGTGGGGAAPDAG
jgi:hypothetical protein